MDTCTPIGVVKQAEYFKENKMIDRIITGVLLVVLLFLWVKMYLDPKLI